MDAAELARWTRFAAKGGIGKSTAISDCVAENEGDLMFLKDDEITVLMQLQDQHGKFLGFCEGVVGRFDGADVRFHGKLKKPIMTRRLSVPTTMGSKSPPSSIQSSTLRSTDDEKPSPSMTYSTSSITIDSILSPSTSNQISLPTSSLNASPIDHVFSVTPSISLYDQAPTSPQVTAPLKIPKKTMQAPSSPLSQPHFMEEEASRPETPPEPDIPRQDEQPPMIPEQSFSSYEDPSTRISIAYSDAEVGIGLTMLRALVDDDDDDEDEDWSKSSQYSTRLSQEPTTTQGPPPSEPTVLQESEISPSARSSSQEPVAQKFDLEDRRPSLAPSATSSGSWEGAIYDDYRYSRYSMGSKVSRFSSASAFGGGFGSINEHPPPIPETRPSLDLRPSVESRSSLDVKAEVRPPPRLSSLDFSKYKFPNRKPIPLALRPPSPLSPPIERSPLLHTNWGSPTSSLHESAASLYTISSNADTDPPNNEASANPSRHLTDETERPSSRASSKVSGDGLGAEIVVDDDEEIPSHVFSSTLHDSPPSSPEPTFDKSDGENAESTATDDSSIPKVSEVKEAAEGDVLQYLDRPPVSLGLNVPSPPPPSSAATFQESRNHLRPSLADLRGEPIPGTNQRLSLFQPHPNAPKAPPAELSPGPMYIQPPQEQSMTIPRSPTTTMAATGQVRLNSVGILHVALSKSRSGPNARGTTIYGRMDAELAMSFGPVPIMFSLDPFPVRVPVQQQPPYQHSPLSHSSVPDSTTSFPPRAASLAYRKPTVVSAPDEPPVSIPTTSTSGNESQDPVLNQSERLERAVVLEPPTLTTTAPTTADTTTTTTTTTTSGNVIQRRNFLPRTPGIRPRSRSFSGFDSPSRTKLAPLLFLKKQKPQIHDDNENENGNGNVNEDESEEREGERARPELPSLLSGLKRPLSGGSPTSSSFPSPPSLVEGVGSKLPVKPSPFRPSPLSLPQISVGSGFGLQEEKEYDSEPKSPSQAGLRSLVGAASKLGLVDVSCSRTVPSSQPPSGPLSPIETTASEKLKTRPSVDTDSVSVNSDSRSFFTSYHSTTMVRQNSLRSKLSLPNLRRRRSKQDETSSLGSGSQVTEIDTVQVKDTDFELVRPNFPFYTNQSSGDLGKDGSLEPHSAGLAPPGSPAVSTYSARSPTVVSDSASWQSPSGRTDPSPSNNSNNTKPSQEKETECLIDAHRQRELRWISVMSSVLPAHSRKTKKIKKLLMEGVPASVRYLVWSHVTNGRARIVAGVYAQLCSRGRVAISSAIAADVEKCFKEHPQLQGPGSPVLTVLQAYLNMVPDIQYTAGLTMVVGQLLLQGPEEEVFWIFVSLMDSYLRPYFSTNSIQLEVDATLFSRALENNDAQVAKRILMDMGIPPEVICGDWFTSVFVNTLPTDYVNRIWDIFMFEGVPFLIRVGLAVINCCRVQILQAGDDKTLLNVIHHPPLKVLPPNPDAFITLILNQKLKDDDVRKQRIKMEAQVKRQTQAQTPRRSTAAFTISLPRF